MQDVVTASPPTRAQLKQADEHERKLLAKLALLSVQITGPGRFRFNGQNILARARLLHEAEHWFGGRRRAIRLLRLFHFIRRLSVWPENSHWWGVLSTDLIWLAELFPPLRGDLWAIENGCDHVEWLRSVR